MNAESVPVRNAALFRSRQLRFVEWNGGAAPEGVALRQGQWPRIRAGGRSGQPEAGPTGIPWVDANGWLIRLARTEEPGKTVWLTYEPPTDITPAPESYLLAIAEAEVHRGRWVISAAPGKIGSEGIVEALEFFDAHSGSIDWQPVASLAILSDFAGPNQFLAREVLNLAARRHLAYRIVDRRRLEAASFAGLRAIAFLDAGPPAAGPVDDSLRRRLMDFAEAGGQVIAPAGFLTPVSGETRHGYHVDRRGRGEIVTPERRWTDPYLVVQALHLLLGRRADVLRLYNAGSMTSCYSISVDDRRGVVEVLNYALRPASHPVTVALRRRWKTARLRMLEAPKPASLEPVETGYGIEIALPPFRVYARIELA